MAEPKLERLHTVPELAAMVARPVRTLRRQLLALHARCAGTAPPWLFQYGDGGKWRVNLAALRRAHPALFEARYVTRGEYEDLTLRVAELEAEVRRYRASNRELAGKIRRAA